MTSALVQSLVAVMIATTFLLSIFEAQFLYGGDWEDASGGTVSYKEALRIFDTTSDILTVFFMVELVLSMTAYWFWQFWGNGWFLFDTFVVAMSVVELALPDDMPGVKQMRILRSFRVFRLFGRLPQLKVLIDSLLCSLIPLSYSFLIMFIFFCIFTTIGVEMFHADAPDEFATFARSIYTLFGVIAYGRWPDDKLSAFDKQGKMVNERVWFIYTFVIIMVIVMLQVVIAVLLDNFFRQGQMQEEKAREKLKAEEQQLDNLLTRRQRYHLDLFLEYLTKNFYSERDLYKRIGRMYRYLDSDRSGGVSFLELSEGLYRLHKELELGELQEDTQRMTQQEFESITDGLLCPEGTLSEEAFRVMILNRLRLFVQRKTADAIKYHQDSLDTEAILVCLKFFALHDSAGPNNHNNHNANNKQEHSASGAPHTFLDEAQGRRPTLPSSWRSRSSLDEPKPAALKVKKEDSVNAAYLGESPAYLGEQQAGRVTLEDVIEKLNVVVSQQVQMQV